jgi:hypothetical protein
MNIVSITVSTAIMGILMPGVMTMSIAPTVAQVRSNNFAVAEAQAVTFADAAAIAYELPEIPDICTVNEEVTEVTCVEGEKTYKMTAKRSFRLLHGLHKDDDPNNNHIDNLFWGTPKRNVEMAIASGRHHSQHLRKLTNDQVRAIRSSPLSHRKLAVKFNVSFATIKCVKHRTAYADVA